MSRISELEFYNDKDVITQIEWLKNNIKADRIGSVQIEQNTDKASDGYGLTTVRIAMENGHEYEGKVISAILKDVRIQSGDDFNVMVFELANGETLTANIPLGSDSYWDKIKGDPKSSEALGAWMTEKTENTDFNAEVTLRIRGDEKLTSDKADKTALEEEAAVRAAKDTELEEKIQGFVTEEELNAEATERERVDTEILTEVVKKADKTALEEEASVRAAKDTELEEKIQGFVTQDKLDEEKQERVMKDDELSARIETEEGARETKDVELEEKIAEKEDKSNKVVAFGEVPSDEKYPSEKLVYDTMYAFHRNILTPTTPPGFEFNKFIEFGTELTNTVQIVFDKVTSLTDVVKVGHTNYKPVTYIDIPVRSAFNGEVGGYVDGNGDIYIWSTYAQSITAVLGGLVVTYAVDRSRRD